MSTSSLRYRLPKRSIKSHCPDCFPKHRRSLSRYVDTRTGEPLPEELGFGKCDKPTCGYHLSPYHKDSSGMSYADQVFEQWKQDNPRPEWAGKAQQRTKERLRGAVYRQGLGRSKSAPDRSPVVRTIPLELMQQSLSRYDHNQLAILLRNRFGEATASDLLRQFGIGTSSHWPGACIFWYIDELNRVRGGQIKLFGKDWHTVKYVDRDGSTRSKTNWVHTVLKRRLEQQQQPVPDWLLTYEQEGERSPCLFGLPQLQTARPDQIVVLVEAPKTAIIGTAYMPHLIWMATGAKSYLTAERMVPLRGRKVLLWPDLDACYDQINAAGKQVKGWKTIAAELNHQGFCIEVSEYLEQHATDEQKRQGLDIADFLLEPALLSPV